jgi:hypothetical protein
MNDEGKVCVRKRSEMRTRSRRRSIDKRSSSGVGSRTSARFCSFEDLMPNAEHLDPNLLCDCETPHP